MNVFLLLLSGEGFCPCPQGYMSLDQSTGSCCYVCWPPGPPVTSASGKAFAPQGRSVEKKKTILLIINKLFTFKNPHTIDSKHFLDL